MLRDDYKKILLRYLTGKLNLQTGSNVPIFDTDISTLNKNVKNDVLTELNSSMNATGVNILGKIYNNQFDNFIVYGNYTTATNTYGYIYIVDRELNGIKLFTTYDSGTLIYPLVSLRQSETGQFYGLTRGTNGTDDDYRIALFNNILSSGAVSGVYQLTLRQTYIIPNTEEYRSISYRQNRIIKSKDSAIYYVIFHNTDNKTLIVRFTINVGMENTWEVFVAPYMIDTVQFDVILDKSTGDEIFYIYGIDIITSPNTYRAFQLTNVLTEIKSISLGISSVSVFLSQAFSVNKDTIYLSIGDNSAYTTTLYKVNGDSLTQISQFNWNSTDKSYLYLELVNNIIFCKKRNTGATYATVSIGILQNDTLYTYDVDTNATISQNYDDYNDFYILSQYNLINVFIPKGTEQSFKLIMDYNINNYNGASYENVNSLLPVKSRLFNADGKMFFARNLYNKYVNGDTTVCTIDVPSTLLNDKEILAGTTLGQTNVTLTSDTLQITKNIYETLNINVYNKITMSDFNRLVHEYNIPGAKKVNNSISNLLDYQNTQATKARVYYTDGTKSITAIDPSTQITLYQTGNNYATYDFSIYVPSNKTVDYVEIISYDETIAYAKITGTFVSGKFNKITQNVSVGESA